MIRHAAALVISAVLVAGTGSRVKARTTEHLADIYMGDWQGTRKGADGAEKPVAAQVIALGENRYRAVLLDTLQERVPALATLEGTVVDGTVRFGDRMKISGDTFSGTLEGASGGTFSLKRITRRSPTLGMQPPTGAVVLFSGKDLDAWERSARVAGVVDLNRALGRTTHAAAYMKNAVWSSDAREVTLHIGSDDGLKVWLNGSVVHENNTARPCMPGQDKVRTALVKGWNEILLKITQGGGDWSGHLRITDSRNQALPEWKARHVPDTQNRKTEASGLGSDGTVLAWQVAGPYTRKGLQGRQLLGVAFAPESPGKEGSALQWKTVADRDAKAKTRWRILPSDILEVVPKSGSLVSKQRFEDHKIHLEFRTPFMPKARGQARGNSGVYVQGRYEVQVLDSYGLEGKDNECGGIYKIAAPQVNMCLPPGQWQTYDITFRAPRFDDDGKKVENARISVVHNGVTIHDNIELPNPTGGGRRKDIAAPGPLLLQDHGNRVQFRNIWIKPL